jgi:Reverse transcriptase (RNA-dependent DNA polymerase)
MVTSSGGEATPVLSATAEDAFDHVTKVLLCIENNSTWDRILSENGIESVYDLAALDDNEISELCISATTTSGSTSIDPNEYLKKHQQALMRHMADMLRMLQDQGDGTLEIVDVLNITKVQYDNFRIMNSRAPPSVQNPRTTPPSALNTSGGQSNAANDPDKAELQQFLKGIKRDKSQYPELKDDRSFDDWKRAFKAIAATHHIFNVFDEAYTPTNDAQQMLWREQQQFIYTVFNETLKTDVGKDLLKEHEPTYDARAIWLALIEDAKTSTKGKLMASDILGWIVSYKYSPNVWKGTAHSFLLHWEGKLRQYENFSTNRQDKFSDNQKKTFLQNAVGEIAELRQVLITAELDEANGGPAQSYQQYMNLLKTAASRYDRTNVNSKSKDKAIFIKNHSIQEYHEDDDYDILDDEDEYDLSNILVNVNKRHQPIKGRKQRVNSTNQEKQYQSTWLPKEDWLRIPADIRTKIIEMRTAGNREQLSKTKTNKHQISADDSNDNEINDEEGFIDSADELIEKTEDESAHILSFLSKQNIAKSGDIRKVLSTTSTGGSKQSNGIQGKGNDEINVNGTIYHRKVNVAITYMVNKRRVDNPNSSLVDRGANGGVFGDDVLILETSDRKVAITGINDHQLRNIPICTGAAVGETQDGPAIFIMHQYAFMGTGKTIHSSTQLEAFGNDVNEKSRMVVGGKQRIKTNDGYIIPLDIIEGLPYMKLRIPTKEEMESLPHVILTSDADWDPSIMDNKIDTTNSDWIEKDDMMDYLINRMKTITDNLSETYDDNVNMAKTHMVEKEQDDIEQLRPYFGWSPSLVVKKTLENTTQFGRSIHLYDNMRKHYKSRYPAMNVSRRNEPVATDTIYSDTPAVDDGSKCAQFFIGKHTLVADVYGMKTDAEFSRTLEDNIRKRGAMDLIISDRAKSEISDKVKKIMRALCIDDWQSEPYHQHQNYAERRYATIKAKANLIMNRTGAPAQTWLLCIEYICYIMNHMSSENLDWKTPLQLLTGETSDISAITKFVFWERVYYTKANNDFPSESNEEQGWFVGIADSVGDAMTFKVLSMKTNRILYRSNVRTATDTSKPNKRVANVDHPSHKESIFIRSRSDDVTIDHDKVTKLVQYDPIDLIGKTYRTIDNDTNEEIVKKVIKLIENDEKESKSKEERYKYLVEHPNKDIMEIVCYNEILQYIDELLDERRSSEEVYLQFKRIADHSGPLRTNDPNYKGCKYNVYVEWVDGTYSWEPLNRFGQDDPVTVAEYGKQHQLLDLPVWKKYKRILNNNKVLKTIIQNANVYRGKLNTKYGYEVPNNHTDAMMLDLKNGNNKWKDAANLEIKQLMDYKTFVDIGKGTKPPDGYQKIIYRMIYDVKHDGRHRGRLVAGGHLTPTPIEGTYSGVVSLRGIRLIIGIAVMNDRKIWSTDIGSAYLEATTQEKVYIVAGREFGELEGHTLLVDKALYGLKSSGLRWHERLADALRDMGFTPCIAEPDIWMKTNGDHYDYIAVYVDDLCIISDNPESIVKDIEETHRFKLKGTGPIEFHLGCDFFQDADGTLCIGPRKYIDKLCGKYEEMFGEKPKHYQSPLEKNDHPELDESDLLPSSDITIYQSMIGALQWAVSLGRFDIHTAVMTMSQFRIAPRIGHLKRLQRIYGYLRQYRSGAIRVRMELPNYEDLQNNDIHDWSYSVYGKVEEVIPTNIPKPLGKGIITTTYVDANLYHDYVSGRAVTGILHLINKTPIDWYSKKQSTVEVATYGSEFVAARIATDQIIDLRNTLRYLGVPVVGKSYLFGDNNSVIMNSTIPHSSLKKRHNALSYHRVREAVSAKIIGFYKIKGDENPADILSKHCGHVQAWPLLKPLLFWSGDTADIPSYKVRSKGEYEHNVDIG